MSDSSAARHLVRSIFSRPELTRQQMASACRVDVMTFDAWCSGRLCPPGNLVPLLEQMARSHDALAAAERWWQRASTEPTAESSLRTG